MEGGVRVLSLGVPFRVFLVFLLDKGSFFSLLVAPEAPGSCSIRDPDGFSLELGIPSGFMV